MTSRTLLKNFYGLALFIFIIQITLLFEDRTRIVSRIPYLDANLPKIATLTAKQDLTLYQCKFQQQNVIGTLKAGETVEFEGWSCPYKKIKLSDGSRACTLGKDKEVEINYYRFYIF